MTTPRIGMNVALLWRSGAHVLACFCTALLLVGWTVWSPETIGNDYVIWPFLPNLHAHFYSSQGIPTIWYPFYTGGFPFGAMPGIQLFNLPAWLLSLIPGYTEGQAIYWNSVRYIVVFTLVHYLVARFLMEFLRLSYFNGFWLSAPLLYNFRTLDQLRYGVYLEVPFYLFAATLCAVWYYRHKKLTSLLLFTLFTQFALTAGHPPSVFYYVLSMALVVLLAAPQVLLYLRFNRAAALGATAQLLGASLVAFLMAAPNWLPTSENVLMNSARIINSTVEWSRHSALNWSSLFANLFVPWEAEVHSAFAGSALYTIALLAALSFCIVQLPRFWWALLLLVFPLVYSFGGTLFEFFYYYVPGFRWIRIPGRYLAMQPIHLLTVAVVAFTIVSTQTSLRAGYAESLRRCLGLAALLNLLVCAVVYSGVVFGSGWLQEFRVSGHTPQSILGWSETLRSIWMLAGLATSVCILVALRREAFFRLPWLSVVLFTLFLVQAFVVNRYGTWIEKPFATPRTWEFAKANHLPFHHTVPLVGPIALDENVGGVATTGYTRFMKSAGRNADCYLPVPRDDGRRKTLLPFFLTRNLVLNSGGGCSASAQAQVDVIRSSECERAPGSMVVVEQPVCESVELNRTAKDLIALNLKNRLKGLTPFSVKLSVNAPHASVLVTPYPWVRDFWEVRVDGSRVEGFELNAGMLGALVPKGKHIITVQYVSRRSEMARSIVFYTSAVLFFGSLAVLAWRVRPRTRLAIAGGLVWGALGVAALTSIYAWSTSYQEQVEAPVLLPNNYGALLKQQVSEWRMQVNP